MELNLQGVEDLAPGELVAEEVEELAGWEEPDPGQDSGEECVCPSCGQRAPHEAGVPCYDVKCPNCGTPMVLG